MNLSDRIVKAREDKRLRKSDLARLLNTDASNYNKLEARGEDLTIAQVSRIAEALDLNLISLLSYGEGQRTTLAQNEAEFEEVRKEYERVVNSLENARSLLSALNSAVKILLMKIEILAEKEPDETLREMLKKVLDHGSEEMKVFKDDAEAARRWLVMYQSSTLRQAIDTIWKGLGKPREYPVETFVTYIPPSEE